MGGLCDAWDELDSFQAMYLTVERIERQENYDIANVYHRIWNEDNNFNILVRNSW